MFFSTTTTLSKVTSTYATNDQLIATAFHRNTMTNSEGGTDDEEFRTAAVIDRLKVNQQVLFEREDESLDAPVYVPDDEFEVLATHFGDIRTWLDAL